MNQSHTLVDTYKVSTNAGSIDVGLPNKHEYLFWRQVWGDMRLSCYSRRVRMNKVRP